MSKYVIMDIGVLNNQSSVTSGKNIPVYLCSFS
jgi:hypothetical protein